MFITLSTAYKFICDVFNNIMPPFSTISISDVSYIYNMKIIRQWNVPAGADLR